MNENLLQYLWKYKIFSKLDFKDTDGNPIEILDFGTLNTNSGPDFSLAKIKTKNIVLAGNIEIHVKSSDWYFHNHDLKKDYQSVILHVVYFNDTDVSELKEAGIPTLELKDYINEEILAKYQTLENQYQFIPCESIFDAYKVPFLFSRAIGVMGISQMVFTPIFFRRGSSFSKARNVPSEVYCRIFTSYIFVVCFHSLGWVILTVFWVGAQAATARPIRARRMSFFIKPRVFPKIRIPATTGIKKTLTFEGFLLIKNVYLLALPIKT